MRLSNPDKVLYPAAGTTKRDVVDYLVQVAPALLPHATARPVTRKRWVDGVGTAEHPEKAFFQKQLERGAPDWIETVALRHSDGIKHYPLLTGPATLVWLANLAALELHVPQWQVPADSTQAVTIDSEERRPNRLVLDLDPGEGIDLDGCGAVALLVREALSERGLDPLPVTSGSKGIHLYAPLDGTRTSAEASQLAHDVARALAARYPDRVVSEMSRAKRPGKVFLDWSQNAAAKTTVAPYSLRGRSRPTVAAPRTWEEIEAGGLTHLEPAQVLDRLERDGDLLAALADGVESARSRRRASAGPKPAAARSKRSSAGSQPASARPERTTAVLTSAATVRPMLATLGSLRDVRPEQDWSLEVKWDGWRALVEVAGGEVRIRSRSGTDLTAGFPEIRAALETAIDADSAVLDGELVVLDAAGAPSFRALQQRAGLSGTAAAGAARRTPATLMLFDVLHRAGESVMEEPLMARREVLEAMVSEVPRVRISRPMRGSLADLWHVTAERGLEGLMAKRLASRYYPGERSRDWLKLKHRRTREVIVVGWLEGNGERSGGLGSVIVAAPQDGGLRYAGRVGTGFSAAERRRLQQQFTPRRTVPDVQQVPAQVARAAHWVRAVVAEVEFTEETGSGLLRHPVWLGLRPGRTQADVAAGD